jgi:hypothetical protein
MSPEPPEQDVTVSTIAPVSYRCSSMIGTYFGMVLTKCWVKHGVIHASTHAFSVLLEPHKVFYHDSGMRMKSARSDFMPLVPAFLISYISSFMRVNELGIELRR